MPQDRILLEVKCLSKKFSDSEPLKDINCTVRQGEVISVIGPSGTGKSTFLRCINRLERPTGGSIYFHGEEMTDDAATIRRMRQKIGMVFQSFNLFSNMTVLKNITLCPMMLKGQGKDEAVNKAKELLAMVGLEQKAHAYPDELSGGQKQRIAILRTLAMEPEILLFDEPTSALDPRMVDDVLYVMRDLARQKYTMIIVTHEMHFAENVSDRIFFMNDGVIYEEGSPREIFHNPKQEATKIFINRLKLFEKVFTDKEIDLTGVQGEIEAFAHRQFMSGRKKMILQLIFEELIYELLIKERGNIFPIELTIMYNDVTEECETKISYAGDNYNPMSEKNNMSVNILNGIVEGFTHNYDGKNIINLQCGNHKVTGQEKRGICS